MNQHARGRNGLHELLAWRSWRLYALVREWRVRRAARNALSVWESAGRPSPPPHVVKQQVIREYAERYGLKTLVETGTYYGDMVEAMRGHFERIYSIELGEQLYRAAARRFARAPNVRILQGDSSERLSEVIAELDSPALFWLDGHYSGGETAMGATETPVLKELEHILTAPDLGHVVLIDDARCFGADAGYPTLEELQAFVASLRPDLDFALENDSIRFTPRALQRP